MVRRSPAQVDDYTFIRLKPVAAVQLTDIIDRIRESITVPRGHFLWEHVGTESPHMLKMWERRSHMSREKNPKRVKIVKSIDLFHVKL